MIGCLTGSPNFSYILERRGDIKSITNKVYKKIGIRRAARTAQRTMTLDSGYDLVDSIIGGWKFENKLEVIRSMSSNYPMHFRSWHQKMTCITPITCHTPQISPLRDELLFSVQYRT